MIEYPSARSQVVPRDTLALFMGRAFFFADETGAKSAYYYEISLWDKHLSLVVGAYSPDFYP